MEILVIGKYCGKKKYFRKNRQEEKKDKFCAPNLMTVSYELYSCANF